MTGSEERLFQGKDNEVHMTQVIFKKHDDIFYIKELNKSCQFQFHGDSNVTENFNVNRF